MAIIRIKRTTGSSLPTGLTFGEMAFIGATGGATASRLYIAGPEGICVWIGAEILNSPTFWSGSTAETTLPTVSAVESRITSRLSSGTVSSFNNQTGAVQGVSAMGATSASSWKKLAVSFTNAYSTPGATGYVNVLGATWADAAAVVTTVGGLAAGANITGNTVLEILEKMLFAYQSATISFTGSGVSTFTNGTVELGQTAANSGNATITTSSANSSNIDANGFTVVYSHTNTSAPAGSASNVSFLGATGYATSKANINLGTAVRATTVGANFTFTARVSDYNAWVAYGSPPPSSLGETATATSTATWYSKMYWGQTTGSSITARSDLTGEQSRFVSQTASNYTFNLANAISWTPPTDRQSYLYILIKDDYWTTDPSFFDQGNFPFGFARQASPTTITLTNDQGFASTYRVYRSASTFNSNMSLYAQ